MVVLSEVGMERLAQLQDKYNFQNEFELEAHAVYEFCRDLRQAAYLGLNVDAEDLEFIEAVLDKLYE